MQALSDSPRLSVWLSAMKSSRAADLQSEWGVSFGCGMLAAIAIVVRSRLTQCDLFGTDALPSSLVTIKHDNGFWSRERDWAIKPLKYPWEANGLSDHIASLPVGTATLEIFEHLAYGVCTVATDDAFALGGSELVEGDTFQDDC